jgi:hypothetical protein
MNRGIRDRALVADKLAPPADAEFYCAKIERRGNAILAPGEPPGSGLSHLRFPDGIPGVLNFEVARPLSRRRFPPFLNRHTD